MNQKDNVLWRDFFLIKSLDNIKSTLSISSFFNIDVKLSSFLLFFMLSLLLNEKQSSGYIILFIGEFGLKKLKCKFTLDDSESCVEVIGLLMLFFVIFFLNFLLFIGIESMDVSPNPNMDFMLKCLPRNNAHDNSSILMTIIIMIGIKISCPHNGKSSIKKLYTKLEKQYEIILMKVKIENTSFKY